MINEFNGMCDDLFTTLLDSYMMKEWGMTWEEFVNQAEEEIIFFFKTIEKTLDE